MLIFSLAHCFQLISITLFFSLSSKKQIRWYSPWYIYSHITRSFLQREKKNGETAKMGDFLPTISTVFLCHGFCLFIIYNVHQ
jgi:hypothetical protein